MNKFWWSLYNTGWAFAWPTLWFLKKIRKNPFFRPLESSVICDDNPNVPLPSIWFHAMSLGEVNSSVPLAMEFKKRGYGIIYSTGTRSGFAAADRLTKGLKEKIVDLLLPMPLDAPWVVKGFIETLKALRPAAVIFVETDIWPNILSFCKSLGVPLLLVNARMRPASYRYHGMALKVGAGLLDFFDLIFASSQKDALKMAERVSQPQKVRYVGNIKWDAAVLSKWSEERVEKLRREIGLDLSRPVWVAGSVHSGEEGAILEVHQRVLHLIPEALLIIAPRKLELSPEVAKKCASLGLPCRFRSKSHKAASASVYVVDTYGELSGFYALGRCAFVGGSIVPFGGHNPLEPAIYGIPVCWGPYLFNFEEIATELINRSVGYPIRNSHELFLWVKAHLQQVKRTEVALIESPSRKIADFVNQRIHAFPLA